LRQAHALARFLLRQAKAPDAFGELDHQIRLDEQFVGVRQGKVGKDIAAADLDFHAINQSLIHRAFPVQVFLQPSIV
jgi:hypothetical protein